MRIIFGKPDGGTFLFNIIALNILNNFSTHTNRSSMKLIPVRSYDDYITANIILGRLKGEDINCFLQDENTVTTIPFLSNITGGIKLLVPEQEAKRAIELLESFENNPA